ncbi:MAG: putative permease YjgP/YjgQ family protein [Firmicutes bacterium]|nr:putative permease YjgP/YjgQ family protein [Bacillota bacterium]
MRILDRYIITELMYPFIFGVCAFSSMFIGGGTMYRIAQYITKFGASGVVVAKLFFYSLPGVVVLTFPMSMLLATLLCFGRLSSSSELIAMRAAGVSLYRLIAPVLITAFFISAFAVIFNETVVPAANEAYNNTIQTEIKGNTRPKSQEHLVILEKNKDGIGRLTYARRYDEATALMEQVTVEEFENNRPTRIETADTAVRYEEGMSLENGAIQDIISLDSIRTMYFNQQYLPAESKGASTSEQKRSDEMSIRELKQAAAKLKDGQRQKNVYLVELHKRAAIPSACLFFALVGAPLALSSPRSSSANGLGFSIVIIFLYYIVMTIGSSLGQNGVLPPMLGAWLPNIAAFIPGVYLLRRASR